MDVGRASDYALLTPIVRLAPLLRLSQGLLWSRAAVRLSRALRTVL